MTRLMRVGRLQVWVWWWGVGLYGPFQHGIARRLL